MDDAYAPFVFRSAEGRLQGIVIDQWQAWERKAGIRAEVHGMNWSDALRRMRAGEFDVIDCIAETPERRVFFDFTPAYATIEAPIFFRHGISGITDLASLRGFPVAVKAGDQHIETLEANGDTTLIPFPSNDAIIDAAKRHGINVFVADAPPALHLLHRAGIEAHFRHSPPIFQDQLRRAVRKGDRPLLRTVSEGFAAVGPRELKQIEEKWFGRTINRIGRYLTYAAYAAAAAVVLIAGLAGWNRTLRKRILQRTAALSGSEEQLHALVARLNTARDEEAARIARELHDDLGQRLTALGLELADLEGKLADATPGQKAQLARMHAVVDETIGVIQEMSGELRLGHLDVLGLTAAIDWQAREFSRRSGIPSRVTRLDEAASLSDAQRAAVFRILQEALTNVVRHAGATEVVISLDVGPERLALEVRDNGRGVTAAELGDRRAIGLLGMRERAEIVGGEVTITGGAGVGTTVLVRIPRRPADPPPP
jgi:signal transduction histidine kinase